MSIPAFLLGFLPFVNLFRAFPIPGLWTELASLLAFGLVLAFQPRGKVIAPKLGPLQLALMILMLSIALRSGVADATWGLICCMVLVCCLAIHLWTSGACHARDPERLSGLTCGWAAGITAAFLLNFTASVLAWQELEWVLYTLVPARAPERWGGTFGQPNQFGVFAGLAVASVIHLETRKKINPIMACVIVLMAVVVVAKTESRTALLVWGGVWLATKGQASSSRLARLMFHGQWIAMTMMQVLLIHHGGGGHQLPSEEVTNVISRPSGTPRMEQWRDAWQLFLAHPWLGVGWGNFAEARFLTLSGSMSEPEAAHTHNLFSQLIVELGFLGWLIAGLLAWHGWRLAREFSQTRDERLLPVVGAFALMTYAMFEYPFWSLKFLFTFVWLCALALPSTPSSSVFPSIGARLLGGAMIVCAAWLAMDYAKFQSRLMQLDVFLQGAEPRPVSEVDVLEVRRETFFVDAVDEYWIDTSNRLDGAGRMKWPVVERLFLQTPTAGGGIKYVMYAVLAGQPEKAAFVLDRFRDAAPTYMFPMMMKVLRREAGQDPALQAFIHGYVESREGSTQTPAQPAD